MEIGKHGVLALLCESSYSKNDGYTSPKHKLTSKILHFCPFSLNNEHPYENIVHRRIFLLRIDRYFKELIKELSNLFQFLFQIGS